MGRISQDRSAAAGGGGGAQDNKGAVVGTSETKEAGNSSVQTKQEETRPWAGYGHRRVPSDGVTWRRSKGESPTQMSRVLSSPIPSPPKIFKM